MITLAPALAWGFADRGLVREGMRGRPQRLRPRDRRARGPRARRRPPARAGAACCSGRDGFLATVVGGEVTIMDGELHRRHPRPPRPPPRRLTPHDPSGRLIRHMHGYRQREGPSAHPEAAGDAVPDDPAAVVADRVVEVAHAEREVGLARASSPTWYTTA